MRILFTALTCLICVSVFGQENPDTWIEITVTCNGDSDSFSTLTLYEEYDADWPTNVLVAGLSNVQINYSLDCGIQNLECSNINSLNSISITTDKRLDKIVDALGRDVNHHTNQIPSTYMMMVQ